MLENQKQVKAAWTLLQAISEKMELPQTDVRVMRAFALEIIEQQPYHDKIMVAGQTIIKFPYKDVVYGNKTILEYSSKKDFLNQHAIDGTWGEEALLFPALEALGIQPVIHIKNNKFNHSPPPYYPFVQQASNNPPRFDIVCEGTNYASKHWRLLDNNIKITTNGNCMCDTMGHIVDKAAAIVKPVIDLDEVLYIKESLTASNSTSAMPIIASQSIVQNNNEVTRQVTKEFKKIEAEGQKRKTFAAEKLKDASIEQLISLYRDLLETSDYLQGRLNEIAKELGKESINNTKPYIYPYCVAEAVLENKIDPRYEQRIVKELKHALETQYEHWDNKEIGTFTHDPKPWKAPSPSPGR